jgi:hypothetical protein
MTGYCPVGHGVACMRASTACFWTCRSAAVPRSRPAATWSVSAGAARSTVSARSRLAREIPGRTAVAAVARIACAPVRQKLSTASPAVASALLASRGLPSGGVRLACVSFPRDVREGAFGDLLDRGDPIRRQVTTQEVQRLGDSPGRLTGHLDGGQGILRV